MMRPDSARAALWAARTARRRLADVLAQHVVAIGGFATVASIVTMLAFLGAETWPLMRGARVVAREQWRAAEGPAILAVSTDEYRERVQLFRADGTIELVRPHDGAVTDRLALPGIEGRTVVAVRRNSLGQVFASLSDGSLLAVSLQVRPVYEAEGRRFVSELSRLGEWKLFSPENPPSVFAASSWRDGSLAIAWVNERGSVSFWSLSTTTSLFGESESTEQRGDIGVGGVTTLILDARGTRLVVGSRDGSVEQWDLRDPANPVLVDRRRATRADSVGITALAYLIGDQSFVVGDREGQVSVWQPVRDPEVASGWRLVRIHEFAPHGAAVRSINASQRDKGFVTGDAAGEVALRHATSEQTLLRLTAGDAPVVAVAMAPKADGLVSVLEGGTLTSWAIENPHPEITLRTLFGKVWYEGYPEPAYVWQSTGGTDDFEPKFSLVPLVFGTVKGTVYALLFAVPIAVLAALYTAMFSPPGLRNVIKPTVEVMAALPSVVLGFVAGLVLAPALERHMPGFLLAMALGPIVVGGLGALCFWLPARWRGRLPRGFEVVGAGLALILVGWSFWHASAWLEVWWFQGDFRHWLGETLNTRFDQRNCVVVGLAMGFAVIPLIFSITEEALANVPKRLVSASLALGATPWQTAVRVVLPAASPGIFSAIMIGFGRAVGETMIVLMATGNTPVLDWSIFTGMRTLSANIAVEIPEAPYGSTLYRVLFLAALLLFAVTFVVNTAAEIVRQRLRQRFQQL